jgi:hypothetical protein
MRRKKRLTIGWVALGLAVVAMAPVTADAKPLPTDQSLAQYNLSHAQGTASPDDRAFSRVDSAVETQQVSHGVGVTPDDRGFARVRPETTAIVVADEGSRFDIDPYVVSGFGLALLLLAGGLGIAIRQSRKTTLSPA